MSEQKNYTLLPSGRIKCPDCDTDFANKANADRHFIAQHLKAIEFKCEHCDFKCNRKDNLEKHTCYVKRNSSGVIVKELELNEQLKKLLNGKGVKTPIGFIDILTDKEIIEVKVWKRYREAIGQLLAYSMYYPTHQKHLHFFGSRLSSIEEENLLKLCTELQIYVTMTP